MSTVGKDMAREGASGEQTNQNAGKSGATKAKILPGPAKKGGQQGNKGKPFGANKD